MQTGIDHEQLIDPWPFLCDQMFRDIAIQAFLAEYTDSEKAPDQLSRLFYRRLQGDESDEFPISPFQAAPNG
jgi:hypothetical protein